MKGLGSSVVDLDCNVNIKVLDKYKRIVRNSSVHNKATVNMIDGILRFMKGDFTKVAYSDALAPEDGTPYIPTQIRFGRIGVKIKENPLDRRPNFDYVNSGEFIQTVFSTTSLQEPCISKFEESDQGGSSISYTFDKIRQTGYSDSNNAECLEFSVYITPGTLVGQTFSDPDPDDPTKVIKTFKPYHYSYWNPDIGEYEAMITEIALTSDKGVLLARVLFDGSVGTGVAEDSEGNALGTYPLPDDPDGEFTPIVQSQSSTVVITWRIGIVSVGKNDKVVTDNDLTVTSLARGLAVSLLEDYTITKSVVGDEDGTEVKEPATYDDFCDYMEDLVNKILNGTVLADLKGD